MVVLLRICAILLVINIGLSSSSAFRNGEGTVSTKYTSIKIEITPHGEKSVQLTALYKIFTIYRLGI